MENIGNTEFWSKNLGFLPIRINPKLNEERFLMLNGGGGDFCLQNKSNNENLEIYHQYSWSTNTKNYIVINENDVQIFNWLNKQKSFESYKIKDIVSDSYNFYKYLSSKSYKSNLDIVPFILDIFKKLRNITYERNNSSEALNLLFVLLISLEEDFTQIDYEKWGISTVEIPDKFEYFVDLIKNGINSINPNLDLILRHSSGALFQEAHREVVYYNPQRDLFGNVSSKLVTKYDSYSSIHYTPQFVARTIVENSLNNLDLKAERIKIFDPACGSSEFLIEALKQLQNKGYKGNVTVIGWDSSQSAISTSKFLLNYEKRTQWSESRLQINIKCVEDSLSENWETDIDLVLMNPPFVSWDLLQNKSKRDLVTLSLESKIKKGKPNLASAFFYKASKSLSENGVIGCILPTTILNSETYKILREEIKDILSLKLVSKLGNFVFEDALTNVSFLIGKREQSYGTPLLLWSKNEKGIVEESLRSLRKFQHNNLLSEDTDSHNIYYPTQFPMVSDESWKILSLKEEILIKDLHRYLIDKKLVTINDIFKINQGAILGVKNIFNISIESYQKLSANEKKYFRPFIHQGAIRSGYIRSTEYVWYPYDSNGMMIKNEEELTRLEFGADTLIINKSILENRTGIKEWWGLTRPRNWQFSKSIKLVSSRFGNSESFGFDCNGKYVIEEGNAFIPRRHLEQDDYYFYLSCFSSNVFDKLLAIYSKPILSGYDLGPTQIKNIPVPNLGFENYRKSKAYLKLVELGRELESGANYVKPVIDEVLKIYFYPKL